MVGRPGSVTVDRNDASAATWATISTRQHGLAAAVEGEVPHEARRGTILDRANHDVVQVPLDVTPPVRTERARTFGEVDLL